MFRIQTRIFFGIARINNSPQRKIHNHKSLTNVVAYEVYEEGDLVFVSNKDTFTLEGSISENTEIFAIGYDGNHIKVEF